MLKQIAYGLLVALVTLGLLLWSVWASAALAIDLPPGWPTKLVSGLFAGAVLGVLVIVRGGWRKAATAALLCAFVTGWWLSISPSNDREWQPDVAFTPYAEIDGDTVTLHGVRDCDYRTELDYDVHYNTRTVQLSKMTGVDIFLCYWGSEWIAHPFLSFQFEDQNPICISIETRKEVGESYSAILGFFRQFELIYIVAEERDVVRVRTKYRVDEDAFLFKTTVTPERARALFLDYLRTLNEMHEEPVWYNALTANCTTGIRVHSVATTDDPRPWDWRLLLPGKAHELLAMHGTLASDLPVEEVKRLGHISDAANAAGRVDDFPAIIRRGVPGFDD
jgi:hypothetical protein